MSEVIVFLGAGASAPFGIPTMTKMAEDFEANLKSKCSPHTRLFDDIKCRLRNYQSFDIEALITVLQDIIEINRVPSTVLNQPSVHYFSAWDPSFEKMVETNRENAMRNRIAAEQLLREVKSFVAESCTIRKQPFEIYDEFFHQVTKDSTDFRQVLDRKQQDPIHIRCVIFTTNYDQVVEAYCHSRNIAYECGQAHNLRLDIANSASKLYSPDYVFQIHKLHGSVNWYVDEADNMSWLTEPARAGEITSLGDRIDRELLIYPAFAKYTFREPFYTMFHYLKDRLLLCGACYVVGYSFRDDDILGLFHDTMRLNRRLSLYVIDKKANVIVGDKFKGFANRVRQIAMEFSIQAAEKLGITSP